MNEDLDLEIGGLKSMWLFADKFAKGRQEEYLVENIEVRKTEKGELFPVLSLATIPKNGELAECYKLSGWSLRSKVPFKLKELLEKKILLEGYSERMITLLGIKN